MRHLLRFAIIFMFLSCSRKSEVIDSIGISEVLDSFGKVQIGISFDEFNKQFPNLNVKKSEYDSYHFDTLQISNKITLKDIEIEFWKGKLCSIKSDYNEILFKELINKFGIVSFTPNGDMTLLRFNTNSPNYWCVYEASCIGGGGMAIFDKKFLDYRTIKTN